MSLSLLWLLLLLSLMLEQSSLSAVWCPQRWYSWYLTLRPLRFHSDCLPSLTLEGGSTIQSRTDRCRCLNACHRLPHSSKQTCRRRSPCSLLCFCTRSLESAARCLEKRNNHVSNNNPLDEKKQLYSIKKMFICNRLILKILDTKYAQ